VLHRVEAARHRVGVALEVLRPLAHDLRRHLGVELHAPGVAAKPVGLRAGGAAGQLDGPGGQLERVGVPLVGVEAERQAVEHRIAGGAARHLEPADLRRLAAVHLGARRRGQQLGAEADAEQRDVRLQRVAQQLDLGAQPRQPAGVADVHPAAEHHDGAERRQRAGHRLPAGRDPFRQLVPARRGALGKQAAAARAGVQDAEHSHRAGSLAG